MRFYAFQIYIYIYIYHREISWKIVIVEENKIFQSFKKFFFILRFSNDSRKIFFLLNLKDTIFDIYIYIIVKYRGKL